MVLEDPSDAACIASGEGHSLAAVSVLAVLGLRDCSRPHLHVRRDRFKAHVPHRNKCSSAFTTHAFVPDFGPAQEPPRQGTFERAKLRGRAHTTGSCLTRH
jgi:hypothetical protein